jgi:hypothetical protein
VDDAVAVFERLVEVGDVATRTRARAWLALSLDRAGKAPEASLVAATAARQGAVVLVRERDAVASSLGPLVATLVGATQPSAAAADYRAYLERVGPNAPWAAHARLRAAELAKQKAVSTARSPSARPSSSPRKSLRDPAGAAKKR